jgi:3-methyladenine DNA glycosylase AlkD
VSVRRDSKSPRGSARAVRAAPTRRAAVARSAAQQPARSTGTAGARAAAFVAALERQASAKVREEQRTRYGITARRALGVPVGAIRALAKPNGVDHGLARALWRTGVYEARLASAFVGDVAALTPAEMDRWMRDFDNWGVCDTLCFALFDRSPHAFDRVRAWSRERGEHQRRASFALLASLALHDRAAEDARFESLLPLVERAASDERNFVKKAVSWALRSVGSRSPRLHAAALALARKLAESDDATERWVGKDALRDLERPLVAARARRRAEKSDAQRAKAGKVGRGARRAMGTSRVGG